VKGKPLRRILFFNLCSIFNNTYLFFFFLSFILISLGSYKFVLLVGSLIEEKMRGPDKL
jgi:cellulose synthase/poly-beta-1,6-N-acetylglucosamine synthase-like glycosyltransferase